VVVKNNNFLTFFQRKVCKPFFWVLGFTKVYPLWIRLNLGQAPQGSHITFIFLVIVQVGLQTPLVQLILYMKHYNVIKYDAFMWNWSNNSQILMVFILFFYQFCHF
jgi:hypothetical protein